MGLQVAAPRHKERHDHGKRVEEQVGQVEGHEARGGDLVRARGHVEPVPQLVYAGQHDGGRGQEEQEHKQSCINVHVCARM